MATQFELLDFSRIEPTNSLCCLRQLKRKFCSLQLKASQLTYQINKSFPAGKKDNASPKFSWPGHIIDPPSSLLPEKYIVRPKKKSQMKRLVKTSCRGLETGLSCLPAPPALCNNNPKPAEVFNSSFVWSFFLHSI